MGRPKINLHPWYPGSLQSEYGKEYPPKSVAHHGDPGYIRTPDKTLTKSPPLASKSIKQQDYPAWPLSSSQLNKTDETPWPKRACECQTTYNAHHNAKEVPRTRVVSYCEQRSKAYDPRDFGAMESPTYKADYLAWPVAPADVAKPRDASIPARRMDGVTDYTENYTNKHTGRPHMHRPGGTIDASIPFSGCTTYGKDFIEKPIPAKYNACVDRPWMRCDSCPPSEDKTPNPGILRDQPERTWTRPPFAIGRARLDDRTEHQTKYKSW